MSTGQEELQALWDKYYSDCHAIVYVVDSGDRARLEETRDAFGKSSKRFVTGKDENRARWSAEVDLICSINQSINQSMDRILSSFLCTAKMIHNQHLDGIPLLLLANKQDVAVRNFQSNCMAIGLIITCYDVSPVCITVFVSTELSGSGGSQVDFGGSRSALHWPKGMLCVRLFCCNWVRSFKRSNFHYFNPYSLLRGYWSIRSIDWLTDDLHWSAFFSWRSGVRESIDWLVSQVKLNTLRPASNHL